MISALLVFAAFLFILGGICTAQTWVQLSPSGSPPVARALHTGIYDAATNEMIIFGGIALNPSRDLNDVWEVSLGANPSWTQLNPTETPPARGGATAVYDATNARMILFGGGLGLSSPCANDVWVLSNANGVSGTPAWTRLSPSGPAPSPRTVSQAVYDPATNAMTIFGGDDCFSTFYNDVWVLSNANGLGGTPAWSQLTPSGTLPPTTGYHSAVYDPGSNRMIVFLSASGEPVSDQVWVLTNANGSGGTPSWIQLAPTGTPITARNSQAAVYDAQSNQLVVFGGSDTSDIDLNDSWVLSNANGLGGTPVWTQLAPSGALPLTREEFPAVYDPSTKRMVVFGGSSNGTNLNDVWVLNLATVGVSVGTDPVGPSFTVDGTSYTGTQSFTWTIGDPHTIATTSPQGVGTQYTFTGWSDSGSLSHSVTASADTTSYTASFDTAYLLTMGVNPGGAGTVTPSSYFAPNYVATVTATPNPGYSFLNWTGPVTNAGSATTTVTMSGPESVTANFAQVAAFIIVSPGGLDFGDVDLGDRKDLGLTVKNTGTSSLKITKITFNYGPGAGKDFGYLTQCGGTLKPGASCKITVELHAQDLGSGAATLNIFYNLPGSPAQVGLSGRVINPRARVNKSSLDFGTVKVGHSATGTVTLTSTGDTPLLINGISIAGSADFSASNCPSSLAPNASCTISLIFAPSAKKSRSATLRISDNALSSPQTVSLSGKGN